jgi:hypothetical protein
VVWQVFQPATNTNAVYAFSFRLDPVCTGRGDGDGDGDGWDDDDHDHRGDGHGHGDDHGDHHHHHHHHGPGDCNDPATRPLLASLVVHAGPNDDAYASFTSVDTDDGLLCVDNGFGGAPATFGDVTLDGRDVVEEDTLEDNPTLIQEWVRLDERNSVHADCDKPSGSGYRVLIYGPAPDCSKGHSRQEQMASLAVAPMSGQAVQLQLIQGKAVTLVGETPSGQIASQAVEMDAAGCNSVPTSMALSALIAVVAWLGLSRTPATPRARRRRR